MSSAARLVRSGRPVPRWAVVSADLSPVLLTGSWLVAGAFQPAFYNPISETVSVLAGHAGTDRWIMTSALFLVGCCNFVAAAGLTGVRLPARILLVVAGLSSIGIAASPEPVVGSTPQHLAWTSLGEVTIAVWPAFTCRTGSPRPLRQGGTVVAGGRRPAGLDKGYFYEPTLIPDLSNDSDLCQNEVFGPVTALVAYDTVDEAMAAANDTRYGLLGSVFSADRDEAQRVAARVKCGMVAVNHGAPSLGNPFGGVRGSGWGRECGPEASTSSPSSRPPC